jgi:hypothetical protein
MAEIFGWEIVKRKDNPQPDSFAPEEKDDGAVVVAAGGVYGTYVDIEGSVKTDAELIAKYREIALQPEVESAVDDIVNEAIVNMPEEPQIKLKLDDIEQPENIKKRIQDEFDEVLKLLEFSHYSYDIFRKWYVDGRIYYHMVVDPQKADEGIKELRWVDSRKIRKIREVARKRSPKNANVTITETKSEYYVFNERGFTPARPGSVNVTLQTDATGVKIAKDAIAYITSGLVNAEGTTVLSYLHKAIKPLNMLKSMEDSLVIYRISRAPERRIFYIDVGDLPKAKAEQYLKDQMTKFKNKVVYDSATGEIRDDRKFMTMLEDFWLPRRGERGTEIKQMEGGKNLSDIDDILYFQKNLYRALNVPISRMDAESTFDIGRATSISRDEVKFHKFIMRLRLRFSHLLSIILGTQLILKKVCTAEEWKEWQQLIAYDYAQDNFWAELKELEIMRERMEIVDMMDPYLDKYFDSSKIRKDVLRYSDEDIEKMDKLIAKEMDDPQFKPLEVKQMEFDQSQAENETEQSKPVNN